jgi:hypothetical protein
MFRKGDLIQNADGSRKRENAKINSRKGKKARRNIKSTQTQSTASCRGISSQKNTGDEIPLPDLTISQAGLHL